MITVVVGCLDVSFAERVNKWLVANQLDMRIIASTTMPKTLEAYIRQYQPAAVLIQDLMMSHQAQESKKPSSFLEMYKKIIQLCNDNNPPIAVIGLLTDPPSKAFWMNWLNENGGIGYYSFGYDVTTKQIDLSSPIAQQELATLFGELPDAIQIAVERVKQRAAIEVKRDATASGAAAVAPVVVQQTSFAQIIGVTSSVGGAGKSFVAANLASVLAKYVRDQSGNLVPVLLVDASIVDPSLKIWLPKDKSETQKTLQQVITAMVQQSRPISLAMDVVGKQMIRHTFTVSGKQGKNGREQDTARIDVLRCFESQHGFLSLLRYINTEASMGPRSFKRGNSLVPP